jgi:hypothetical protein
VMILMLTGREWKVMSVGVRGCGRGECSQAVWRGAASGGNNRVHPLFARWAAS